MNIVKPFFARIRSAVADPRFIWFIGGLMVFEALWIALTGRYPMAFDEDFHLGVIQLYANHLDPFWRAHPAGGDAYGAIARDPSYLYHYLMSFPYRLIRLCTHNLATQVMVLRFINVGLFISGIPLYRRLLSRFGASRTTVHTVLLLFVLIPIVPLLAAQINYDNLIFPLTALSLLLTLKVADSFKQQSIDTLALMQLTLVCVVSSLVKYAYLPIFMAIALFIIMQLYRAHRSPRKIIAAITKGWSGLEPIRKWTLVAALIVMGVLFTERYAVNIVRYHTPVPDCAQVLLYDQCQHYGPWIRDYNFALTKPNTIDRNPITYTQHWFYGMWFRSFFAVDGPQTGFQTRGPLTVPAWSAVVLASLSGVAFVYAFRALLRKYHAPAISLFLSATIIYTIVLWLTEYKLFLQTGQLVAINGRYMILLLPGIMVLAALSLRYVLRKIPYATAAVAVIAVLSFAWGGGTLTYILRSNDAWYWQHTVMTPLNHAVQRILKPVVPGGDKPNQFMH